MTLEKSPQTKRWKASAKDTNGVSFYGFGTDAGLAIAECVKAMQCREMKCPLCGTQLVGTKAAESHAKVRAQGKKGGQKLLEKRGVDYFRTLGAKGGSAARRKKN